MPRALLLALVIHSLAGSALGEKEKGLPQHKARTNRVWSVWLIFDTCGVVIEDVQVARINNDGSLEPWQRANTKLLIIQWTFDVPMDSNYGAYDLLGDMAQTRHIVRISGRGTGTRFDKMLWVSPAGFSGKPIKAAPLRDLDKAEWNVDDWQALKNWYLNEHEFSTERFFTDFRKMLWHIDQHIQLKVKIGSSNCQQ